VFQDDWVVALGGQQHGLTTSKANKKTVGEAFYYLRASGAGQRPGLTRAGSQPFATTAGFSPSRTTPPTPGCCTR
jgi:hypothetical protein